MNEMTAVYSVGVQLPNFENYIRPQVEFYITVIRLFAVKMATVVVILLSLRAKLLRVRLVSLSARCHLSLSAAGVIADTDSSAAVSVTVSRHHCCQ